jgi:hypothetical protein
MDAARTDLLEPNQTEQCYPYRLLVIVDVCPPPTRVPLPPRLRRHHCRPIKVQYQAASQRKATAEEDV